MQIVVSDAETMRLADRPSLNRATYRRMVIEMCMPEFRGDVEAALETLFPECPLRAEDLLYQLCVEVNPSFDIHEVQLSVDPALDPPSTQTESADLPDSGDEYNALLARLRKRSRPGNRDTNVGRIITIRSTKRQPPVGTSTRPAHGLKW